MTTHTVGTFDDVMKRICICTEYKTCEVGAGLNPAKEGRTVKGRERLDRDFGIERCALKYGMAFSHMTRSQQGICDTGGIRNCCWKRTYGVKTYVK